jgi:hypothetical protein
MMWVETCGSGAMESRRSAKAQVASSTLVSRLKTWVLLARTWLFFCEELCRSYTEGDVGCRS